LSLCSVNDVLEIPGMSNVAAVPTAWLSALVIAADAACKKWCKQNLELQSLVEFYSGDGTQNIVLRQTPVWQGQTLLAAGSQGAVLPQTTLNVVSTAGFCPGTAVSNPSNVPPTLQVQTGPSSWTAVTYTGTTATSFTGCSGGNGTTGLSPNCNVAAPVVWCDPQGYAGQFPQGNLAGNSIPFADATIQPKGLSWLAAVDSGGTVSNRGLLQRVGGYGSFGTFGGWGGYGAGIDGGGGRYGNKLGGTRLPYWPFGFGNLQVAYSAGYYPVPSDLNNACAKLVAYMARNDPQGANLGSEGLGNYSYNVLVNTNPDTVPEIGSIVGILKFYRDFSLGT
jgi:hypothetical protein